jgi:hypothetical protein
MEPNDKVPGPLVHAQEPSPKRHSTSLTPAAPLGDSESIERSTRINKEQELHGIQTENISPSVTMNGNSLPVSAKRIDKGNSSEMIIEKVTGDMRGPIPLPSSTIKVSQLPSNGQNGQVARGRYVRSAEITY